MKKDLYETIISDVRWIAYDVPANLGWIAYIAALVLIFTNSADCSRSILTPVTAGCGARAYEMQRTTLKITEDSFDCFLLF